MNLEVAVHFIEKKEENESFIAFATFTPSQMLNPVAKKSSKFINETVRSHLSGLDLEEFKHDVDEIMEESNLDLTEIKTMNKRIDSFFGKSFADWISEKKRYGQQNFSEWIDKIQTKIEPKVVEIEWEYNDAYNNPINKYVEEYDEDFEHDPVWKRDTRILLNALREHEKERESERGDQYGRGRSRRSKKRSRKRSHKRSHRKSRR